MRIIKPTFEILEHDSNTNPQQFIERIARTCYKSEDKITEDSNRKFIKAIYDRGHWAMLEHYIFIYKTSERVTRVFKNLHARFITVIETASNTYIAFSARGILELEAILEDKKDVFIGTNKLEYTVLSGFIEHIIRTVIKDYDCYELFGRDRADSNLKDIGHPEFIYPLEKASGEEIDKHCRCHLEWVTVRFTVSRAVTHELVRHRLCSFAQESQRYVGYNKNKFGGEIAVIKPCFLTENSPTYNIWREAQEAAEKAYMDLINEGAKPQEAREVLTNSTKAEIVVTAPLDQWERMFLLRCDTPAHPCMREVMIPLFNVLYEREPEFFEEAKGKINFDFDYSLAERITKE